MLRAFIDFNKDLSRRVDRLLVESDRDNVILKDFVASVRDEDHVADVGGGKKPAKTIVGVEGALGESYDGFDLDLNELIQAQNTYSTIQALDITRVDEIYFSKYDKVICRSTLEHVLDAEGAMSGLAAMLREGGRLYVCVPHRYAIFAILNRNLPNEYKRKLLHYVFPNKKGDGFPAYYLSCTLTDMEANAAKVGLWIVPGTINKIHTSSYFTFFLPLYLLWRAVTAVQFMFSRDYCERFEVVFEKRTAEVKPQITKAATAAQLRA